MISLHFVSCQIVCVAHYILCIVLLYSDVFRICCHTMHAVHVQHTSCTGFAVQNLSIASLLVSSMGPIGMDLAHIAWSLHSWLALIGAGAGVNMPHECCPGPGAKRGFCCTFLVTISRHHARLAFTAWCTIHVTWNSAASDFELIYLTQLRSNGSFLYNTLCNRSEFRRRQPLLPGEAPVACRTMTIAPQVPRQLTNNSNRRLVQQPHMLGQLDPAQAFDEPAQSCRPRRRRNGWWVQRLLRVQGTTETTNQAWWVLAV